MCYYGDTIVVLWKGNPTHASYLLVIPVSLPLYLSPFISLNACLFSSTLLCSVSCLSMNFLLCLFISCLHHFPLFSTSVLYLLFSFHLSFSFSSLHSLSCPAFSSLLQCFPHSSCLLFFLSVHSLLSHLIFLSFYVSFAPVSSPLLCIGCLLTSLFI